MRTKPPRSNRSPEVPEQLRNSSPSCPIPGAKYLPPSSRRRRWPKNPSGLAKHISGYGVFQMDLRRLLELKLTRTVERTVISPPFDYSMSALAIVHHRGRDSVLQISESRPGHFASIRRLPN